MVRIVMKYLSRRVFLGASAGAVYGTEGEVLVELDARALYEGLEASRVLLDGNALVWDGRNAKAGGTGVVVTDVLDLGGNALLSGAAAVGAARVAVDAAKGVRVQVRSGGTYFEGKEWSGWQEARSGFSPVGRYCQLRMELGPEAPSIRGVRMVGSVKRRAFAGRIEMVQNRMQQLVRSPLVFGYERADQADLVWLRKTFALDTIIAPHAGELEQLRAVLHWVASRKNLRPGPWEAAGQAYPWHVRQVMSEREGGAILGHCMSYCEVFLAAAAALGWHGRHWAMEGVRDTGHEVPEIWLNSLGKWVYFDPSLDTYYTDKQTGRPFSILELHRRYLATVLKPGEQLAHGRHLHEDRLKALRGKHPVRCETGGYVYGEKGAWDWEWDHGYMSAGWLQLTPRNDFHSQVAPRFSNFGKGAVGFEGYPIYVDAQTPLPEEATRWYTRERDLWWTLNQAAFRMVRTAEDTVQLECGHTQPHFRRFVRRVDDGAAQPVESRFSWRLRAGDNRLEVTPEDAFGRRGLASSVVVRYERG
ncbi:MAG: hypothetical protein JNK87_40005 [Bryobacterales bacterium]|nr:hypothetical protein [Bryobacterales bacterium]